MGKRVFFALDIDDAMRDRIVSLSAPLRTLPGKINWTRPQNLHVTMNFLGDTPDERIADLCSVATETLEDWNPGCDEVTFTIGSLMCFPPGRRARMIWAPVAGGNDLLASMHRALNGALTEAGWRGESRPFKGHVTVARIKSADPVDAVRRLSDDELGDVTASELTLYESTLTRSGPIYRALAHIPIGPRG